MFQLAYTVILTNIPKTSNIPTTTSAPTTTPIPIDETDDYPEPNPYFREHLEIIEEPPTPKSIATRTNL